MKFKLFALAAAFAASTASAAVTYDEEGYGFVGKGDIQSLYDWNNAMLQKNADDLQFRFIASSTVTWLCEWWTGPESNLKYHSRESSTSVGVNSAATLDSRKNTKGMVTGFNLNGFDGVESNTAVGFCPGVQTLNSESLTYEGSEEPLLQVRFGDSGEWKDLPISL